ncbi:MAG TPA: phospholipid carrier-dependent glycosyltransferase [Micromonosporaceae bacterium]
MTTVPMTTDVLDAGPERPSSMSRAPIEIPATTRRRLAPEMPTDRIFGWVSAIAITILAGVLRLIGLAQPNPASLHGKIFDEVYYATEGNDLFTHGVEWNTTWKSGDFVVHPPLGKWIIGVGEQIFGYNTFGWRIMPLIFGTLSILILIRITRRLFRSTILGCAAGLLMTLDGMEFVLSRTALLDIFLMFFILAAFGCIVVDRDQRRRRWLRAMENGLDPSQPGAAGRLKTSFAESIPWWRLGGAFMAGCAMSVKWSAIWYIILFVILIFMWEVGARRSAGVRRPWRDTLLDETGWLVAFGLIIVAVYLASWTGWFATNDGYDRNWYATTHHGNTLPWGINALVNLYQYHHAALHFHDTLSTPHLYQSWPWQWMLLGRPVAFYYSSAGGCGAASCSAEVLLLGTPLLWWSFLPAIMGVGALSITRRDWRAAAIFFGAFAGIATWFPWELSDRTMFSFYALPAVPFLIMAVVYLFGMLISGPLKKTPGSNRVFGVERRLFGGVVLGVYLLVISACFAYFYPLFVGEKITYAQWFSRMWLGSRWI